MSWMPGGWMPGDSSGNQGYQLPGLDRDREKLLQDVEAWLQRDDIADSFDADSIIVIAEDYIATDVRLLNMERSTTLTVDQRRIAMPGDFLSAKSVYMAGGEIEFKTPDVIRKSPEWNGRGPARSYTVEGHEDGYARLVFAPAGTEAAPFEVDVLYYGRLRPLVAARDTNWLLRNHYPVYLYATLRAAAEWLQEEQLEAVYRAKYDECVARVNRSEQRKRLGAVAKKTHNRVYAVV